MQYQNLIGEYDETKVSAREDEVYKGKIAWYDVTDLVRELAGDSPSILDYASKIKRRSATYMRVSAHGI